MQPPLQQSEPSEIKAFREAFERWFDAQRLALGDAKYRIPVDKPADRLGEPFQADYFWRRDIHRASPFLLHRGRDDLGNVVDVCRRQPQPPTVRRKLDGSSVAPPLCDVGNQPVAL